MRRLLVALLLVPLLAAQGCLSAGADDAAVQGSPARRSDAADVLTDPSSWTVAKPAFDEAATSTYDSAELEQAVALATHVTQTATFRTDLMPSHYAQPEELTFVDDVMTAACRTRWERTVRRGLAAGATQKQMDAVSVMAFWSLGNDTWHLRSELKPRAVDQRIDTTTVTAPERVGGRLLSVTQTASADVHFWISGDPRLVRLSKTITYFLVRDPAVGSGDDEADPWGSWRVEAFDGRVEYGDPRPDPPAGDEARRTVGPWTTHDWAPRD